MQRRFCCTGQLRHYPQREIVSIDGRAASEHQAIQVEIHFEHDAAHRPSLM